LGETKLLSIYLDDYQNPENRLRKTKTDTGRRADWPNNLKQLNGRSRAVSQPENILNDAANEEVVI
jgi:hypothetical protein